MKSLIFILASLLTCSAYTCTYETIHSITEEIDPYNGADIQRQVSSTLETLSLCDENLEYAGQQIGNKFDAYYGLSVQKMSTAISQAKNLSPDLVTGLGKGLVSKIDVYYPNSTFYMVQTLVNLGRSFPVNAKQFALALLKKQDAYYKVSSKYITDGVQILTEIAQGSQPGNGGGPVQSSIWAFQSNNSPCEGLNGPWGYFEYCPRFYASVADQLGNRILLACKPENFGIEFRVFLATQSWNQIANTRIQSMAFGTSSTLQSLGIPYVIPQAKTLLSAEPVAMEILNQLRSANALTIAVRANSGEVNKQFKFSLAGSNLAIGELLKYCH